MIAARPTRCFSVLDAEPLVEASQDPAAPRLIINNLRFDRPAPVRLVRNAFLVDDVRETLATRGFYAVSTSLDRAALQRLAPHITVAGASLDELEAQDDALLTTLLEEAAAEARRATGLDAFASDVQFRDMHDRTSSAPFLNFHLDAPVVGLFAVVSFMRSFPHLEANALGCATLGDALRHPSVRRALATPGLAYDVAGRAPRPGQVNYWLQLNDECPHAAPPLAFFEKPTSASLVNACARQRDACSETPEPQVRDALDAVLSPAAVLAEARRRALVWDACRVLHAAVYLPERAAPRCSVEVRCSVLAPAEVLKYRDALVHAIAGAMGEDGVLLVSG